MLFFQKTVTQPGVFSSFSFMEHFYRYKYYKAQCNDIFKPINSSLLFIT